MCNGLLYGLVHMCNGLLYGLVHMCNGLLCGLAIISHTLFSDYHRLCDPINTSSSNLAYISGLKTML